MDNIIEIKNLSAGYGKNTIIHDISAEIKKNKITAIIGPNGSGKTTLIKSICGLIKSTGTCQIDGEDISLMPEKKKASKIGYLSSESSVTLETDCLDAVLMGVYLECGLLSSPSSDRVKDARDMLELFGLSDYIHKSITTLSNGMKQMVMISRLFIRKSPVFILDEPESMLDESKKKLLMNQLKDFCDLGTSSLICSHDINLMMKYADCVIVLSEGTIAGSFSPKDTEKGEIKMILEKAFPDSEIITNDERVLVL